MNSLNPITTEIFNNDIKIKFNNINEGFNSFSNGILEPLDFSLSFKENQVKFINFFKKSLAINNSIATIDFYLKNLSSEEILILLDKLDYTNKLILINELKNLDLTTVYFKLTSADIMDFITTLNTESLFFCTVFFTEYPLTIWGNYNLKFPVFFKDSISLESYKALAKECGLAINSIIIKE